MYEYMYGILTSSVLYKRSIDSDRSLLVRSLSIIDQCHRHEYTCSMFTGSILYRSIDVDRFPLVQPLSIVGLCRYEYKYGILIGSNLYKS